MAKVLDSPRRGRPKKETTMEALPLRISDELSKQIDEYHQRLQRQLPGLNISKADAVRQLITVGLKYESKPSCIWDAPPTIHFRHTSTPPPGHPPLYQMGLLLLVCITNVDEPWRCNPFPIERLYFALQHYPAR